VLLELLHRQLHLVLVDHLALVGVDRGEVGLQFLGQLLRPDTLYQLAGQIVPLRGVHVLVHLVAHDDVHHHAVGAHEDEEDEEDEEEQLLRALLHDRPRDVAGRRHLAEGEAAHAHRAEGLLVVELLERLRDHLLRSIQASDSPSPIGAPRPADSYVSQIFPLCGGVGEGRRGEGGSLTLDP